MPTPSDTPSSTASDSNRDTRISPLPRPQKKHVWQGIYTATARSEQTSYYGPSSLFYFISRIGAHLGKSLQQPYADQTMQPRGMNKTLVNPSGPAEVDGNTNQASSVTRPSMSRTQEEYFISLFWESYHCLMPVIDETDFRRHYASLWDTPGSYRKHSALVDIVIALCVQYGSTFIPRETPSSQGRDPAYDDATIAGRWYYRRCQSLLTADLESPSLTTVQCHIYSIVYLCCASFQNMAHIAMAQATRIAQILGLHLEPPADMPRAERELRKRVWWVLYATESKTCTKLGRPFSTDDSQMTVTLPSDDIETASLNGASLGSYGTDVTWLSYSVQIQKLLVTIVDIYRAVFDRCGKVLAEKQGRNLYKDPQALEICAEVLARKMPLMQTWLKEVPAGLKTQRRGDGEPFSVDRSPVDIDTLAPRWLQSQRLSLELTYHSMAVNLYRPFIVFSPNAGFYTPTVEQHAAACVNHAIAHTLIMHRGVSETDLMTGWTEFFLWHWNSTITIIGFILAYPIHPATATARKALDKAIEVCDIYGANFAVAASGAGIARDLTAKADLLVDQLRKGMTSGSTSTGPTTTQADVDGTQVAAGGVSDDLSWLDPSQQDDYFTGFMDWALTVDSFNSFEHFYDTSNIGNLWTPGP